MPHRWCSSLLEMISTPWRTCSISHWNALKITSTRWSIRSAQIRAPSLNTSKFTRMSLILFSVSTRLFKLLMSQRSFSTKWQLEKRGCFLWSTLQCHTKWGIRLIQSRPRLLSSKFLTRSWKLKLGNSSLLPSKNPRESFNVFCIGKKAPQLCSIALSRF